MRNIYSQEEITDLDQDPGSVQTMFLDGVVQRCLVLNIFGVNVRALTFCIQF